MQKENMWVFCTTVQSSHSPTPRNSQILLMLGTSSLTDMIVCTLLVDNKTCHIYFHCRDMGKPINVLTGLDYWLDNLMCNVPELAMCYHIDGIVQVCALTELCTYIHWYIGSQKVWAETRAVTYTCTCVHTHCSISCNWTACCRKVNYWKQLV